MRSIPLPAVHVESVMSDMVARVFLGERRFLRPTDPARYRRLIDSLGTCSCDGT